ncbi:transposase [Aquamicrobium terrae]|uniref:Transposase n=1 Tax=Aquamicrobium terrae TaxID=1324945 RepID=A0ABV2MW68_9HYPH
MIPRRWKVIETVREKFSCSDCEAITEPPAPFSTSRSFSLARRASSSQTVTVAVT